MKQINLLPEDIARHSARRRNRPYIIAGCIGLAMIGIVWGIGAYCHIGMLFERYEFLRNEVVLAEQRTERYRSLQQNIAKHRSITQSDSAISDPVQLSLIMTLLSHLMPAETFAESLTITSPPVLVLDAKARSAASDRLEKRASVDISVSGLAVGGKALPQLIDNLASSNILSDVRIIDQKDVEANNKPAQYFQIVFRVPLAVGEGVPVIKTGGGQ